LILAKREILAKTFKFRWEIIISDDCDKAKNIIKIMKKMNFLDGN
jgi:hypothetical protein